MSSRPPSAPPRGATPPASSPPSPARSRSGPTAAARSMSWSSTTPRRTCVARSSIARSRSRSAPSSSTAHSPRSTPPTPARAPACATCSRPSAPSPATIRRHAPTSGCARPPRPRRRRACESARQPRRDQLVRADLEHDPGDLVVLVVLEHREALQRLDPELALRHRRQPVRRLARPLEVEPLALDGDRELRAGQVVRARVGRELLRRRPLRRRLRRAVEDVEPRAREPVDERARGRAQDHDAALGLGVEAQERAKARRAAVAPEPTGAVDLPAEALVLRLRLLELRLLGQPHRRTQRALAAVRRVELDLDEVQ